MKKEISLSKEDFIKWHSQMKDSIGRYRTRSLFWEFRVVDRSDVYEPIFTSKSKSHTVTSFNKKGMITYPSLKEIYMSYVHVPGHEYEFAMDVFGSWQHWLVLCDSAAVIRNMINEWRDELTIKLKAEAIRSLLIASKDPSAVGVNAAKYLANEDYLPKKVGRITKEEKIREIKLAAGIRDTLAEDMDRLGLSVITGTK
jgi:hypothetical protein